MRHWTLAILLLVLAGCDSSVADPPDGELSDSGWSDAGRSDAGVSDAGLSDSGLSDAASDGGADGGRFDGGATDAGGASDAGDAGAPEGLVEGVRRRLDEAPSDDARAAIVHEVAWEHRWPLRDATGWLFVTRWAGASDTVHLVGGPFGWETGRPATRVGAEHHAVFVDDLTMEAASGAQYKWRVAGEFRAPSEATAYGHDGFGEYGYVAPPVDARWRERFPDHRSEHLGAARTFRALLPAGFEAGDRARRVVLMHDGQNVFDPAAFGGWRVDAALDAAADDDTVVLAVDNAPDRMSAYTHVPDDIGSGSVGGDADDYLDLLQDEALPFFRARYGLTASGSSLAVGGSSLGGLVSLYAALTRPAMASCVIAMSPTLGWGAYADGPAPNALLNLWTAYGPTSIYLDSGGEGACSDPDGDGVQEDAAPRDNLCVTNQLRDHLDGLGYDFDVDLFHWHEPGAGHNEAAWAARVPRAFSACRAGGWEPG